MKNGNTEKDEGKEEKMSDETIRRGGQMRGEGKDEWKTKKTDGKDKE